MQSKGVDFKNFTREILVYLDEHLMDDLDENLKLANCFKGIYNEVRYYPIPVLAFKTGLGQFMGKGLQDNSILQQSESKKIEKVQVKKPIKKELVQKEKEVEKVEEKKEVPKEKEQKIENKGPSGDDTKDIKQQLVENIENLLVRSVIKTFSHIDSIEDNKLEIVIINETQYKMISNPEKLKIVEDCVAKLFGDVKVLVKYMSKEDFLQKKLKG